jgi:UPF0755 protein
MDQPIFWKNRRFWYLAALLALIAMGLGFGAYRRLLGPNVRLEGQTEAFVLLPTGCDMPQALDSLRPFLRDETSFVRLSQLKGFQTVKPGRYRLVSNMGNLELIGMLRAGRQAPVKVTFNNTHDLADLAGKIDRYFEADSAAILGALQDARKDAAQYGLDSETFRGMFLPNTYEMYWTNTPQQFIERMKKEYDRFWNEQRLRSAQALGLRPEEVVVLASIVEEETLKADEKPRVAGVYLNRLRLGMLLQADPTVKWAVGDFGLRRILNRHLEIDSPYNTYRYPGLPPGPIRMPSASSIEAVLRPENHEYLFFCAREDFSGYHNFAATLAQHGQNARRYQQALNRRGIY